MHKRSWHRLLHDSTDDHLASSLSKLPHVNVTFVPFHFGGEPHITLEALDHAGALTPSATPALDTNGDQTIGSLVWRTRVAVRGRVEEIAIETVQETPSLVAVISDGTGKLDLLFLGRPEIGGMQLGALVKASGMAAAHWGRLTIINPVFEFVAPAPPRQHSAQPDHD
jgi:hypothetical protein